MRRCSITWSGRWKRNSPAAPVGRMLGALPVVQRVSFLVGRDGRIAHVWPRVNAARHAADVLEEVRRRTKPGTAVA